MIPIIHRTRYKPEMTKIPIRRHVGSSKRNILPTALPRTSRNTTTVLRLSRRLHYMKHHLISRINSLIRKSNTIPLPYMRKNYIKPTNFISQEIQ